MCCVRLLLLFSASRFYFILYTNTRYGKYALLCLWVMLWLLFHFIQFYNVNIILWFMCDDFIAYVHRTVFSEICLIFFFFLFFFCCCVCVYIYIFIQFDFFSSVSSVLFRLYIFPIFIFFSQRIFLFVCLYAMYLFQALALSHTHNACHICLTKNIQIDLNLVFVWRMIFKEENVCIYRKNFHISIIQKVDLHNMPQRKQQQNQIFCRIFICNILHTSRPFPNTHTPHLLYSVSIWYNIPNIRLTTKE